MAGVVGADSVWQLKNRNTGEVLVAKLQVADSFWRRLLGWQFRARVDQDAGLLLSPCRSIHTCWMRFAIDLLWLDQQGVILQVHHRVRPWRIALAPRGAFAVVELPVGRASELKATGISLQLAHDGAETATVPGWLRYLQ